MKKLISLFLIITLCFSLVGCRKIEDGEVTHASTVEEFSDAAGVSIEFAQSLNDAVAQIDEKLNRTFDIGDVYNFRPTDDWANGKRYTIWLAQEYVLTVYEESDRVVSIRTDDGGFAYSEE